MLGDALYMIINFQLVYCSHLPSFHHSEVLQFGVIDIALIQEYIRLKRSLPYIANMRIAISGTHFTGKSTLVEALSEALPQYTIIDEPYHILQEEGYEFAEMPSIEDFELQLERSIESMDERAPNIIFDRCPADILGYLLSHTNVEAFDLAEWLPRIQTAIRKLDLLVFLPIEEPDRIVLPSSQDAAYRQRVDEKLKEIILENLFDFEVDVLEVTGSPKMRVERVLGHISY